MNNTIPLAILIITCLGCVWLIGLQVNDIEIRNEKWDKCMDLVATNNIPSEGQINFLSECVK